MRFVKRVLCIVLAVSCVFFTGCNSIVYNGDLHFQSFEPETLPPLPKLEPEIEKKIQDSNEEMNQEKYKVEGTDAFYILPGHENRPDRIIDFKVLGYTDEGWFVYAYLTSYYGDDVSGEAQENREGTAPEERVVSTGENSSLDVMVLMSYNPENRAYKVFYSSVRPKSQTQTVVNKEGGDDEGISGSVENSTVMAGKLVKNQVYYIFNNNTVFIFDGKGNELLQKDYGVTVSQEASRLMDMAKNIWKGKKSAEVIEQAEVSVSDMAMDGEGYVYLSVTVELPDEGSDDEGDDMEDEDEDEVAQTTFTSVIACYDMDIGGDSWVEFVSDNENWDNQVEYWKACGGEFDSRYEMNRHMGYTMDKIKTGDLDAVLLQQLGDPVSVFPGEGEEPDGDFADQEGEWDEDFADQEEERDGNFADREDEPDEIFGEKIGLVDTLADRFTVFRTKSGGLNMELAGVADLSSFQVDILDGDHKHLGSKGIDLYDLVFGSSGRWYWDLDYKTRRFLGRWKNYDRWWWSSLYWKREKDDLKKVFSMAKQNLTLMAQGDQEALKYLFDDLHVREGSYLMIPWIRPSGWNSKTKSNDVPISMGADGGRISFKYLLGALFAYKTSVYKEDQEKAVISRFSNVETDWEPDLLARDDLSLKELDYPLFTLDPEERNDHILMEVSKWSEGDEERTFAYIEDGEIQESVTETLDKYPVEYRLKFPQNTKIYWTESVDTGEMVAASGNLGCIYYEEKPQTEQEIKDKKPVFSKIRYNDGGQQDILSDSQMPGRAMDVGVLYASQGEEEAETVCFITDEGMKFYKKQGGVFPADKALYLPMDKLSQAAASYGLGLHGETSVTDSTLEVSEEQDQIIQDKTENGVSSDSYKAENLSLLNSRDVLVSSLSNGILLVNTDNGLVVNLQPGCYYGTFAYDTPQGRRFMVLGYRTEEYSYQPGDIAWSKCYSVDLDSRNAQLASKAVKDYLDSLANSYLSRSHRLIWSESESKYEILEPSDEEKKADNQARRLFYGTEADQDRELQSLIEAMGGSGTSGEIRDYARKMREKLQTQKDALAEIYRLAGLGSNLPFPAEDPKLLEQEGLLITAAYEKTLENLLVDLKLSDAAISLMEPSLQMKYREYQKEKAAAQMLNKQTSGYQDIKKAEEALKEPWSPDIKTDSERAAIENMACYETVLNGIRRDYLNSLKAAGQSREGENISLTQEERTQWETYLSGLLGRVSPDRSVNEPEKGVRELCSLAGLGAEAVNQEEMAERISKMRHIWELEEMIVEETLKKAGYQGSPYRDEFKKYQETLFDTENARGEVFRSGAFYGIIEEMKDEFDKEEAGGWDEKMAEILGQCGAGIVLDLKTEG